MPAAMPPATSPAFIFRRAVSRSIGMEFYQDQGAEFGPGIVGVGWVPPLPKPVAQLGELVVPA
jgi:hypothetical protein